MLISLPREADDYGHRVAACGARGFILKSKLSAATSRRRSCSDRVASRQGPAKACVLRDPVLLLPALVAAGLAVGGLGVRARCRGRGSTADLALSWALVAAALVAAERPRWRIERVGCSLRRRLRTPGARSPVGELTRVVDARRSCWRGCGLRSWFSSCSRFRKGGPWSRAGPVAIACAYAAALGGQLVGVFVLPDSRDLLSVAPQQTAADAVDRAQEILGIAVALAVLFCSWATAASCAGRLDARRRRCSCRRAASAVTLLGWLGWVSATASVVRRSRRSAGQSRCCSRSGSSRGSSGRGCAAREASELVVELQTEGATSLRDRLARVLGDPTLELAYRLDDGRYVDAAGRPSNCRKARTAP